MSTTCWRVSREALLHAVKRSCEIKADIVARDEREGDLRAVLNFGHTFGHAIEAGLGFGAWLHGEAVAAGMVLAARLVARLGLTDEATCARLVALLSRCGLPTRAPSLTADRYLELMRLDKKARDGDIRFTLLARARPRRGAQCTRRPGARGRREHPPGRMS